MIDITRIYDKYQTGIPAKIIKHFNLDKTYKIKWNINDEGNVELEFIKTLSLNEMIGRYSADKFINGVKLKNKFKKGEIK